MQDLISYLWCKLPSCWVFDQYGDYGSFRQHYFVLRGLRYDVFKWWYKRPKGYSKGTII